MTCKCYELSTDGIRECGKRSGKSLTERNTVSVYARTAPVSHKHWVLVGDVHLYNRADVVEALQAGEFESEQWGDELLVLRAFEQWGDGCVQQLNGDFAFIIWDCDNREVFAARDHLGVSTLYYLEQGGEYIFSDKLECLVKRSGKISLNMLYVTDYLLNLYHVPGQTVFHNIHQLPAGCYLKSAGKSNSIRRYWSASRQSLTGYSFEKCAQQLRSLVEKAVVNRLKGYKKVGIMLSGGLDSSAITCLAAGSDSVRVDELAAFSKIVTQDSPREKESDKAFVEIVQQDTGINVKWCDREGTPSHSGFIKYFEAGYSFPPNPFVEVAYPVMEQCREYGIDALLQGYGGDEVVSCDGYGYLQYLEDNRRLWRKRMLIYQHRKIYKRLTWRYVLADLAKSFLPASLLDKIRRPHKSQKDNSLEYSHLTSHLLDTYDVQARYAEKSGYLKTTHQDVTAKMRMFIDKTYFHNDLEQARVLADCYGYKNLMPLIDKSVIEYCLAIPQKYYFAGGWDRSMFRKAMEPVLPKEVVWRKSKTPFARSYFQILKDIPGLVEKVVEDVETRGWHIIDRDRFIQSYERIINGKESAESNRIAFQLAKCLNIILFVQWLEKQDVLGRE